MYQSLAKKTQHSGKRRAGKSCLTFWRIPPSWAENCLSLCRIKFISPPVNHDHVTMVTSLPLSWQAAFMLLQIYFIMLTAIIVKTRTNNLCWSVSGLKNSVYCDCFTYFASSCRAIICHRFHEYMQIYLSWVDFLISLLHVPSLHWHLAVVISTHTELSPSITITSSSTNSICQTFSRPTSLDRGFRGVLSSKSMANGLLWNCLQSNLQFPSFRTDIISLIWLPTAWYICNFSTVRCVLGNIYFIFSLQSSRCLRCFIFRFNSLKYRRLMIISP